MVITKHVFKRCIDRANAESVIKFTEKQIINLIKTRMLRFEMNKDGYDDLLEEVAVYAILLANLKKTS